MNQVATIPQTDAMTLVGQAVQNGAGVENIDKLIELVKFNDEREALKEFNKAFTAAQADFPSIKKTKKAHNSLYAPYSEIVRQIRPTLIKHGLGFRHTVSERDGLVIVTCHLSHSAGHSEDATISAPADDSGKKNNIQAIGSAVTYLKRYTLEAVTGVVTTDDDTDADIPPNTRLLSDDDVLKINAAIDENELNREGFMSWIGTQYGASKIEDLPETAFGKVWSNIKKSISNKAGQ